jgi:ligand-binding SRPBCC domain-containing protein
MDISRTGFTTHRLTASQVLGLPQERIFVFFQDPENLFEITPPWLDFRLKGEDTREVFEGAEFDYTIRWLGLHIRWRSRIIDYRPPNRFTDIQIKGPYSSWGHLHTFESVPEGTLMRDEVIYRLPLAAVALHPLFIRRQLEDIFAYRAVRIARWAGGEFQLRSPLIKE